MPVKDEENLSTTLFCRSNEDGPSAPDWDNFREAELQGQFEVGLTVADRYFLKKKLGDGSMGRVFLANDLRLDRPVAMKVVAHRLPGVVNLEAVLQPAGKRGANPHHHGE